MSVMAAATALLQVQERPLPYIAVSMLAAAGAQVTGVVVILLSRGTPTAYLAGYLIASAAAALAGIILTRALGAGLAPRPVLRAALAIGLPTIPHSIAILVLALGDRLIIQAIDGAGQVGRYQVAYALGSLSIMILSAVQNAWVPLTFGAEEHPRCIYPGPDLSARHPARGPPRRRPRTRLAAPTQNLAPAGYDPADLDSVVALVALAGVPWAIFPPSEQGDLLGAEDQAALVGHTLGRGGQPDSGCHPAPALRPRGRRGGDLPGDHGAGGPGGTRRTLDGGRPMAMERDRAERGPCWGPGCGGGRPRRERPRNPGARAAGARDRRGSRCDRAPRVRRDAG